MGRDAGTANPFRPPWTPQQQQMFMNHVRYALDTDQKINNRFATELQKTLNYPVGPYSLQTRILRTARKRQKLERAANRRVDNVERNDRVIAQRNERIRELKAREWAKPIGGLKEYRAAKKLSNANKETVKRIDKDIRRYDRLENRITRCEKKIDDLNAKAYQSL